MTDCAKHDSAACDQTALPLLAAVRSRACVPHAPFYVPGHKQGAGASTALVAAIGKAALRADLPELPEFGTLFPPSGPVAAAQELAAAAFGARRTWFSVNGSTAGVVAAIAATCKPGDTLVLPRNVHRCALSGLVLSGAMPAFAAPPAGTRAAAAPVTPEAIAATLARHPEAAAVLVVSPTYEGVCADLEAIAELAHARDLPLLVDEAHGAHFAFHSALPTPALAAGADVAIQSWHKTLGALTQAAAVHLSGARVDPERLARSLQVVQSSSPSHLLLASLDAARQQMALHGRELLGRTLGLAREARDRLRAVPRLALDPIAGRDRDATRLTVDVTGTGWSGFAADALLHETLGVTAELPTLQALTFVLTIGTTPGDIDALVAGLEAIARQPRPASELTLPSLPPPPHPELSPRAAYFTASEPVAISRAVGRLSAETVCPYPPGIPVLLAGERVSEAAIAYLLQVRALGSHISIDGCSDPTLATLRVLVTG